MSIGGSRRLDRCAGGRRRHRRYPDGITTERQTCYGGGSRPLCLWSRRTTNGGGTVKRKESIRDYRWKTRTTDDGTRRITREDNIVRLRDDGTVIRSCRHDENNNIVKRPLRNHRRWTSPECYCYDCTATISAFRRCYQRNRTHAHTQTHQSMAFYCCYRG